jgi:small subunit ribosomal protein S15
MTTTIIHAPRIAEYQIHESDTGSCEVQVALLTSRITALNGHLDTHPKDHSTHHGLLKLVGQRNRLMRYLQQTDLARYDALIEKLGIRGVRTSA